MAEPVAWRADGVPLSERFGDIYHTETGAQAQSRHVFLAGCGLPEAWADRPQWRILETGFGFGLNFLTAWQAWRADPRRPRMLHAVSIEAHPVARDDLLRAAHAYPELAELAALLAAQWHGLLPGFHRLSFDDGRVLLTLCIGDVQPMLRAQAFEADSIFLDGFSPDRNPAMWSPETLKAVTRFARRGTRLATWTIARAVRDALGQNGFQVVKAPGLPPKRDCLRAEFAPAWTVRRRTPAAVPATPGHCAVVGGGLAGAAVAASLARRGWQVTVLDAAERPAAGASGVPAAVFAPHVSPDDALLSRLTRAGLRLTRQQLAALLPEGIDWRGDGVIERRRAGDDRLPTGWTPDGPNMSWRATASQRTAAGLEEAATALWHEDGGWAKPARLVAAWLATPGVRWKGGVPVAGIEPIEAPPERPTRWSLRDGQGRSLAEADRVVIACGTGSAPFAPHHALQPVRGQVAWGRMASAPGLPATPVNGDGHFIAQVPDIEGAFWLTGATFDRDRADPVPAEADTVANRVRLARLHPTAAALLAPAFDAQRTEAWVGVRCASSDRRPLAGPVDPSRPEGPWLCTAMGSRGLSFAVLCAELLAAQWHAEPWPLPAALARGLDAGRTSR